MKRVLYLALLLCLLAGCTVTPEAPWVEQFDPGGPETAIIAYVPLDDRPVNTIRVQLLAQSAGFGLLMPEKHLYRTALDGQPLNSNGTQYGDGDALLRWIETTQADYYVISVDQILSGGLVNSRWMTESTDETQQIDRLLTALAGKPVVLFDTIMRLAPTVGYGGYTLAEYEALRAYGKLPRPPMTGELTADRVIAGYPVATDLENAVISRYLAARSRKLKIAEYLLSAVSGKENILVFYGIDDSSPENTIQTNEIAFLQQHLENGSIFAGTDEMGMMAVARTILNHYGATELPNVGVRYFGADPEAPADVYDVGSLKSNIAAHLEALGMTSASDGCDLELLIFGGDDPTDILTHYRENLKKHIPTMIVDLGRDFYLPSAMLAEKDLDFGCLLSYSSWNTAGNSIGIALSGGFARYLYLKNEGSPVKGANWAFLKSLALSFAKDISYGSIKSSVSSADETTALRLVQQGSTLCFDLFAEQLEGKHFLISLNPMQLGTIPRMTVTSLSFPWGRTFEAEIEISIE